EVLQILVDAGEGVAAQTPDGEPYLDDNDEPVVVDDLEPFSEIEGEFFVGPNDELYPMDQFDHATVEEYETASMPVPSFIRELENEDTEGPVDPTEPEQPEEPTDPEDSEDPTEDEPEDNAESPELTVETDSEGARPGDSVNIVVSGFTPEIEVAITLDGEVIGTVTTDGEGNVEEVPFDVPLEMAPGTYEVVATAVEGEQSATATLEVTVPVHPSISVSAEQAQVGDTLRIIIENPQELIEEYGDVDYEFNAIGQFFDVNGTAGFFENTGIEVAENPYTFE